MKLLEHSTRLNLLLSILVEGSIAVSVSRETQVHFTNAAFNKCLPTTALKFAAHRRFARVVFWHVLCTRYTLVHRRTCQHTTLSRRSLVMVMVLRVTATTSVISDSKIVFSNIQSKLKTLHDGFAPNSKCYAVFSIL